MQAQPYSFWVSAFTLAGEGQVSEIVAETPQVSMPAGIASFSQVRFSHHFDQNRRRKLGQQTRSVGTLLFRDYGLNNIFFRNKTFLFFKIER